MKNNGFSSFLFMGWSLHKIYCLFLILALALPCTASASSLDIYVSPNGNDAWDGLSLTGGGIDKKGPLATLTKARDVVRELRKQAIYQHSTVTVHVGAGTYYLDQSLKLGRKDSGTPEYPVIWKGIGEALISGGIELSEFIAVTDKTVLRRLPAKAQSVVVQCDLKSMGIEGFGQVSYGGFAINRDATHHELAYGGETMTIARWPNEDWLKTGFVDGERSISEGGKPRGVISDSFTYLDNRVENWQSNSDIWMHGYWYQEWADGYLQVRSLSKPEQQVVIEAPHSHYGYKEGARYRFLNVLEELDAPKEYYLDRENGILYFWPPETQKQIKATLSILQAPLIQIDEASHINLKGFTLASSRGRGVFIRGGSHVVIEDCYIRNIGNQGIKVDKGQHHQVRNCVITQIGGTAVGMKGGDRKTLEPSNFAVENCEISHFGKWFRTYKTGVYLVGVGMRISNNTFHHAPHCAIHYKGNDFTIEYNKIYKTCTETSDVGAIYTTRDWTARGTIIRYNYIHDNYKFKGGHHGSIGIYLDDFTSGQKVYGNIIVNSSKGIQHASGRDNHIFNNVIVDCEVGILLDGRVWAHKLIDKKMGSWNLFGHLENVPYRGPAYAKYPNLSNMLNEEPLRPMYNVIEQNIIVRSSKPFVDRIKNNTPKNNQLVNNHIFAKDPGFIAPLEGNYRLKKKSTLFKHGFVNVPFAKIGRQN